MASRKQTLARLLPALLTLAVLLALLPARWTEPARSAVSVPLHLALRFASAAAESVMRPLNSLAARNRDASELESLRRRAERLESVNFLLREELAAARRKLDALSAQGAAGETPRVMADVVGGDASAWRGSLVVAAGERHGVRPDMPAVWAGAAVGKVVSVTPVSSRVLLLHDPAFRAAVRFTQTGARGILAGAGEGRCRVEYVPHDAGVQPGEPVATAGADGVFPPHFEVGRCVRASRGSGELTLEVEVAPRFGPRDLEAVEILLWRPPEAPPPAPSPSGGR